MFRGGGPGATGHPEILRGSRAVSVADIERAIAHLHAAVTRCDMEALANCFHAQRKYRAGAVLPASWPLMIGMPHGCSRARASSFPGRSLPPAEGTAVPERMPVVPPSPTKLGHRVNLHASFRSEVWA
ncbi:hypothetical protein GCM10009090_21980 [[Pseudomonas] boreopolis]|uniref:Uncharacterized protein n=1 Tax=Xanthomonas boreopolis TaxID=86183 RepID=A0A919KID6_9XANT|nr:hypothetical protein GCM10009090_21980 [[Pseudomonas] boreopolis]